MTLIKIREQKEKQANKKSALTPTFSRGLKLAGAFCAFAIVFCIGYFTPNGESNIALDNGNYISIARGDFDATTVDEIDTDATTKTKLTAGDGIEFIDVRAQVNACKFSELTDKDVENNIAYRCVLTLSISELVEKTAGFNQDKVSSKLDAYVLCTSLDALNSTTSLIGNECNIRLTVEQVGDKIIWTVIDFSSID